MNERWWFLHPGRVSRATVVFVRDWWFSRPLRTLLGGLPALSVLVAMGALIGLGATSDQRKLIQRYQAAGDRAIKQEKFDEAEICLRKLAVLEPENLQHRFRQGLIAAQNEELAKARQIMHRLAPADKTGYAPAHVWLAVSAMKSEKTLSRKQLPEIKRHLLRAVAAQPRHTQAHVMLSQIYLLERNFQRAMVHLAEVVDRQPTLRLQLARLYAQAGQQERSREQARLAAAYYGRLALNDPANVDNNLAWAMAELLQGKFEVAVQILQNRLHASGDNRYRMQLSQTYLEWADSMPPDDLEQRLQLVEQALTLAPDNPLVIERLAPYARKENPRHEEVRRRLLDLLSEGKATGMIHVILGTVAAQEGDLDKALLHLEQAHQDNFRAPAVANNLAWVLANVDPPQLDRALSMANAAVELAPNDANIRETRGQIHLRKENWKQAVADLELALERFPDHPVIHQNLALAYEQLGDSDLAATHRKRAQIEADQPESRGPAPDASRAAED